MIETEQLEEIQNRVTRAVLCSRNKLIEQLLTELPLTERLYQRGLQMMKDNWEYDKVLWDEAKAKVIGDKDASE